MNLFKVAIVQQCAVANDIKANMLLAVEHINAASCMGADIVLFPEMWSNGYAPPFEGAFDNPFDENYENERKAWLQNAVSIDSEYVHAIKQAAKKENISVVATLLMKNEPKPQNAAIIIDKNGEIVLQYAKVHTCDFSLEALLSSGDEFKVCTLNGVKLGVMICYDREFPESARVLMLKGAEIILVPNACDMNNARINQLNSRAFENMTGIAMSNYPDTGWGNSCAFSPVVFDAKGEYCDNTIIKLNDVSQQIVLAVFDMDEIRAYRKSEAWGNAYRKPNAYKDILSCDILEPFKRDR